MHDLREIVNAILYVCRTGVQWEYLPHDFPPYKTVYDYYAKWDIDGTTETPHDLLRQQVRVTRGRAASPSAAIIDSQSVKTSCDVAETSQGIDAGKKIKGRKRHIATDVLGLLLVAIVTAASVQDSVGGQQVERTLGWLMQYRRLVRDYEALPRRSRTMILWAMANKMSRELAGESTQTWRTDPPKADIYA